MNISQWLYPWRNQPAQRGPKQTATLLQVLQ